MSPIHDSDQESADLQFYNFFLPMAYILDGLHLISQSNLTHLPKAPSPLQSITKLVQKMNLQAESRNSSSDQHAVITHVVAQGATFALSISSDLQQNISVLIRSLRGGRYRRHLIRMMRIQAMRQIMNRQLKDVGEGRIGCLVEQQGELMVKIQLGRTFVGRLQGRRLFELCHLLFIDHINILHQYAEQQCSGAGKKSRREIQMQEELKVSQMVCHTLLNLENYECQTQQEYNERCHKQQKQTQYILDHFLTNNQPSWVLFHPTRPQIVADKSNLERNIRRVQGSVQDCYDEEEVETLGRRLDDYQFVLADIQVQNLLSMPIAEGGTSQIFVAKVLMSIINSADFSCEAGGHKRQATIAYKTLKPALRQQLGSLVKHEREVVRLLKGTSCNFIPKFYGTVRSCELSEGILMQIVMGQQLDSFLQTHSITTTVRTKITLLYHIILGLRKLRDYQIVHLDLKPTNIIVSRLLTPKIIDFGEAYHHKLCPKDYRPGYTFPYCAPEVYQFVKQVPGQKFSYSEKQDVFAFGSILFQSIFGRKFFQLGTQGYSNLFSQGDVRRIVMQCIQGLQLAEGRVWGRVLMGVALRCLDPDPSRRPQLDWLGIIFKRILDNVLIS